jgi:hypothetical protein
MKGGRQEGGEEGGIRERERERETARRISALWSFERQPNTGATLSQTEGLIRCHCVVLGLAVSLPNAIKKKTD